VKKKQKSDSTTQGETIEDKFTHEVEDAGL